MRAALLALASLASGCLLSIDNNAAGTPPPGADGGSCRTLDGAQALLVCTYYMGQSYSPEAAALLCADEGGTYDAEPCPAEDRVGSCRLYGGTASEMKTSYYAAGFDADSAQADCNGVFTAEAAQ